MDLRPGLPGFSVVGLPDTAVQEAREQVRSGVVNQAFALPPIRIIANLAPADLRKAGAATSRHHAPAHAARGNRDPDTIRLYRRVRGRSDS